MGIFDRQFEFVPLDFFTKRCYYYKKHHIRYVVLVFRYCPSVLVFLTNVFYCCRHFVNFMGCYRNATFSTYLHIPAFIKPLSLITDESTCLVQSCVGLKYVKMHRKVTNFLTSLK